MLETEHGPRGGDEINLIDLNDINQDEIQIMDGQFHLTVNIMVAKIIKIIKNMKNIHFINP